MNRIVQLIGCSFATAGTILSVLDYATWLALLCSLTGIGASAGAAILAYKATISTVARTAGRYAAKSL